MKNIAQLTPKPVVGIEDCRANINTTISLLLLFPKTILIDWFESNQPTFLAI